MNRTLTIAAAAVATALGTYSAQAGCADPGAVLSGSVRVPPPIVLPAPALPSAHRTGDASKLIVGTWLATYVVEGNPFGQAYIQWHSDGTEWESINLPISGGNVCVGSWTKVDAKNVSRNHWGWLYTNGVLSGYFNETETDKVARDGTYAGTNDQKIYDLNGNLLNEVTGTSSAVLIAP